MKLARLGRRRRERLAALDNDGAYRDLSAAFPDLTPDLSSDPGPLLNCDLATYPPIKGTPRIGSCVGDVGKFTSHSLV